MLTEQESEQWEKQGQTGANWLSGDQGKRGGGKKGWDWQPVYVEEIAAAGKMDTSDMELQHRGDN